jgi:hypothetical protein
MTATTTAFAIAFAFLIVGVQAHAQNPRGVDPTHYQCYVVTSTERFSGKEVKLHDQFGETQVTLQKPNFICAPVRKDHSRPRDERTHFVCYHGFEGQSVNKRVRVQNQFGNDVLGVGKPVFVCVPSLKAIVN